MIKDNDLIADIQLSPKTHTTTYVIKNHNEKNNNNKTKLGEVFYFLPHGIIDKTETGIGGTSLELDSNRNSIIVQPYNNVAESKSQVKSLVNKYDVLFFSSDSFYKSINKKSTTKTTKKLTTISTDPISRLNDYILKCSKNKKPIKIICIINQLEQLYECLNKHGKYSVKNFHLVLDEIDTLQEHSSFRNEASICFNIYKSHDPSKRTMISATLMKFHDKDLEKEPLTILKYETTNKPLIQINNANNIKEEAVRFISKLALTSKEKIVVYCNNFSYCTEVIKALENENSFKKRTIKILCSISQNSKNRAGKYFGEMLPGGILPADVTIFTAAYFSGHDINERFHNIILAEKLSPSLRLSPRLIYQITGRCRDEHGPYSNQLIISLNPNFNVKYNIYTAKELIDNVANNEALFDFTAAIKQTSNKYMKAIIESMENVFYDGTSKVPSVYLIDRNKRPVISYFKVDSIIEEQKTYNLYLSWNKFIVELEKRFNCSHSYKLFNSGDTKLILKKDNQEAISSLLPELIKLNREQDFDTKLKHIELSISLPITPVEKLLLSIFKKALGNENINLNRLSKAVGEVVEGKQVNARLGEIDFYLDFNKYVLLDDVFKENIIEYFPTAEIISAENLSSKIKLIIATFKKMSKTKSPNIKKIINRLEKKPRLINNSLLEIKPKNLNSKKRYLVSGYDKFHILSD